MKVPLAYGEPVEAFRGGYAHCSTDGQDLTAQRSALAWLGVDPERAYTLKRNLTTSPSRTT